MAKVLLIEDDTNLREIFAMRLQAEGYETLSAGDGEEGLVVAMKEKPDLIIADVMMPKLSGFEMLETLRATPEMSKSKVIMMTALGQAEDRTRGEKLGVVKYLVKSQVTLEDFVRVVKDVLQPGSQAGEGKTDSGDEKTQATNNQESEKPMQNDPSMPAGDSQPAANPPAGDGSMPAADSQMSAADEQANVQSQVDSFAASTPTAPADPAASAPADGSAAPAADPAAPADPAASAPADGSGTPPAAPAA